MKAIFSAFFSFLSVLLATIVGCIVAELGNMCCFIVTFLLLVGAVVQNRLSDDKMFHGYMALCCFTLAGMVLDYYYGGFTVFARFAQK
jgi:hypothetical protein